MIFDNDFLLINTSAGRELKIILRLVVNYGPYRVVTVEFQ